MKAIPVLLVIIGLSTAFGQTYQAVLGQPTIEVQETGNSSCGGTESFFSSDQVYTHPGYPSLTWGPWPAQGPFYIKSGKWVATTIPNGSTTTTSSEVFAFQSTVTLSAKGAVTSQISSTTTFSNSSMSYVETQSQTGTLDLDSGAWTATVTSHFDFTSPKVCSEDITDNSTGQIPITLQPANLPPTLAVMNPFAPMIEFNLSPGPIDQTLLTGFPATSLAADGISAVVLVFQSTSDKPVAFTVTPAGTLSTFDPNYLTKPNPPGPSSAPLTVNSPSFPCDADGTCTFAALLWGPGSMPARSVPPSLNVSVTASQTGATVNPTASVTLMPPPLVLIHGVWSSADQAWPSPDRPGFWQWLTHRYPHNLITTVDYGSFNYKSFDNQVIQGLLLGSIQDMLSSAALQGMAARTVDVVAHSMGGLVTRYFVGHLPLKPTLPSNPVHKLITIGTPHAGSQLTTVLDLNQKAQVNILTGAGIVDAAICAVNSVSPCTLGGLMAAQGKRVDTAVVSLEPASSQLNTLGSTANKFSAIAGSAPLAPVSATEKLLNTLIGGFLPGQTISSILGSTHDTIVATASQIASSADDVFINGIVHANICQGIVLCPDTGETASPAVWSQILYWLTGGTGQGTSSAQVSLSDPVQMKGSPLAGSPPPSPFFDLTDYAQVAASNVTFSPPTTSTLMINSVTNITASSSTKTITELLLFQTVKDPSDTPLLFVTQAPFTIPYTPTRPGAASFTAIAVFNDNTYATTSLNYALQTSGSPIALNLVNVPLAGLDLGSSRVVKAKAVFANGVVDVTSLGTYTVRSGASSVFSVSAGGTVTANGPGLDWLDVTYGGLKASAQIAVGSCQYSLAPVNQIVASSGGSVSIQVASGAGCAWTVSGGASWLTFGTSSGSGGGIATLSASANATGATRVAIVSLPGSTVAVTQPATACSYTLSTSQINVAAAGASGTLTVTTSCPIWCRVTQAG